MNAIDVKAAAFSWPGMPMLFDLSAARGDLVIVTGPSGSGKSTLLNLIAGFEAAESGKILLDGLDCTHLPPSARPVSMLFQEHNLFGHLSVEANAGLGIAPRLRFGDAEKASIAAALQRVGLDGKGKRLPHDLSGGERQRAAFARTLLQDRPILLLDEPFASLGPSLRAEMMALLQELQAEKRRTILAVTHHPAEWNDVAGSFAFVDNGRITARGKMHSLDDAGVPDAVRAYLGATRERQ